MKSLVYSVIAAVAVFSATPVLSQSFPDQPVTIVVPYPPGGGADYLGRFVSDGLSGNLGQSVIVENRDGGNTILATEVVSRAEPDGYTLLLASSAFATNPSLYPQLPYDSSTAFEPISLLGSVPLLILTHPNSGITSISDLISKAKENPGALTYASYGSGSAAHLAGELMKLMADVDILHIPYRGSAPALTDLLAGRVDVMFSSFSAGAPHAESGSLVPLAVTSADRNPALPDVPSVAEAGVPGYSAEGWNALMAPAGTPEEVIAKLQQAVAKTISEPATTAALETRGYGLSVVQGEALREMIQADIAKWADVVQRSGATIE